MKTTYYSLFIVIVLMSCATIHHQNPGRPLEKGEYYFTGGIVIPFHNFELMSLQFENFVGIGNEVNFGFSLFDIFFVVPGSFTFSKYQKLSSGYLGYSFILNDLFERTYNPLVEGYVSYFVDENNFVNSIDFGVGYYPHISPFDKIIGKNNHQFVSKNRFSLLVQMSIGYENLGLSMRYNGSLSKYYIEYYNRNTFSKSENGITLKVAEIDTLVTANLEENFEVAKIILKSGKIISIREREPYADCIACGQTFTTQSAYLGAEGHALYWVVVDGSPKGFLEFDLNDVLSFNSHNQDISLKRPSNYIDEKMGRYNQHLESISLKPYFEQLKNE